MSFELPIRHMKAVRRISLTTVSLALALLLVACDWLSNPREKATAYLAEGDLAAARIAATNAVDKDPNDSEAYIVLGQVLAAQGDLITADRTLVKAIAAGADPSRVDGLRARVLLKSRSYAQILKELHPGPSHQGEALASVLAARGEAQLATAQLTEAKASFDAALQAAPEHPEALLGQAQLAYLNSDPVTALGIVERVIANAPRHSGAWEMKAFMLQFQGKIDEAVSAFEQAARHDPATITADLAAAQLLIGAGRFDAAQKHISNAFKRTPNALFAHHVQALLYFYQGKYDQALVTVQEILKSQPKFAPTILLAGMTYLARGELNQAEDRLRPLLQAWPDDILVRKLYATTQIRMGNAKGALHTLAPVLERFANDPGLLTLAAEAHVQAKDFASATIYYERAAKLRPEHADALTRLGLAKYLSGQAEHGLATLEQAAAIASGRGGAEFAAAVLLLEQREFKKALAAAQSLQSKQPQNPIGFNLAGAAQLGLGDRDAARKSFEQSVALAPGYWPAAANLARLDLAAGQRDAARVRIQKVLATDQNSIEAMTALLQLTGDRGQFVESLEIARQADPKAFAPRLLLARAYTAQDLGERALPVAREAVAIAPDRPDAQEVLGLAQLAAGRRSEALTTFRELTTRQPKSALAQIRLAEAQAALGDVRGAESAYAKAIALQPGDPTAVAGLARLYSREQRFAEAMKLSEQLKQSHPQSAVGPQLAGDLLFQSKRYAEAAKAYDAAFALAPSGELLVSRHLARTSAGDKPGDEALEQWLKQTPNDSAVRMMLAEQHYLAGRYPQAIEHYAMIVKKDPNHAVAFNNLASVYLKLKDARALTTAQAAHSLKPEDGGMLDTLGVAQMHFGNPEEAVETLKKAVARNPGATEIRVNYAIALARAGERSAARDEIRRLVDSGKRPALDAEAKALLGMP